jgi:choline dehydrogenase-like flavoprotein
MPKAKHYNVVVIGTGFGGTMTALPIARAFKDRKKGETVLMLERGTWWTTPVGTVQDKEVATYDFLKTTNNQPVQYWSTPNHFSGFLDLFTRCFRHKKNEDGLYDMSLVGRRGFLGIFGRQNDGVSILRACGVGGGSLVYSNITLRPPDFIFDDNANWPLTWKPAERDAFYDLARKSISKGVLWALEQPGQNLLQPPPGVTTAGAVNTGLSNIVTRTARLDPNWVVKPDPNNSRGLKQIQTPPSAVPSGRLDANNDLWIDRARLFQTAVSTLTPEFGAVDLAINDFDTTIPPGQPGNQYDAQGNAKNYCERQGRCNVGCLPGARHTLNKQLMAAALGTPPGNSGKTPAKPPVFQNNELEIAPLIEVDVIVAQPGGGYEIRYFQRDEKKPWRKTAGSVTADKVVVSAGCLGTSELMLRSKVKGTLPNLSDRTGYGFSTNGDYIAFVEDTKYRMRMTRGPVTTSFGHFNTGNAQTGADATKFHTVEDQGIPPALATIVGAGVPLIRKLSSSHKHWWVVLYAFIKWLWKRAVHSITALFKNYDVRQDIFKSDDEVLAQMLCVVAQGRDRADGQFRLGTNRRDTPLRLSRDKDKHDFWDDPIYAAIANTLARLAPAVTDKPGSEFQNPFVNPLTKELKAEAIAVTHPLGGCRMAKSAADGVCDELGRVFDKSKAGPRPFYEGLYIADGSIIPTGLGINPSLTISAVSLRIANQIIQEL